LTATTLSDRMRIETQLREEVERAQLECKLVAARLAPSGEEKQRARNGLEHALQRLTDCVMHGVVPADVVPADIDSGKRAGKSRAAGRE
jgi:hypothetical protein